MADLCPQGDYSAKIINAGLEEEYGETKAVLILGVRVLGAPFRLRWSGGFEGKYLKITVRSLRAAGWVGNDLKTIKALVERSVGITVNHKTAKSGRVYEQIFVNDRRPLDETQAADFASSMERVIADLAHPATEDGGESSPPGEPPLDVESGDGPTPEDMAAMAAGPHEEDDDIPR